MNRRRSVYLSFAIATLALFASAHAVSSNASRLTNSYHMYTAALPVSDTGVVRVPSRYRWSVETSHSGVDDQGAKIQDRRILLRLYDPQQNFTAMTAQMDLATAAKLHHELGDLLVKKLQNPDYQHRPQLYPPEMIPILDGGVPARKP